MNEAEAFDFAQVRRARDLMAEAIQILDAADMSLPAAHADMAMNSLDRILTLDGEPQPHSA